MVSLHEKIDTSSPAGRLFYTIIAAMAQWEREEIGDRVRASIEVRAKNGKPLNGSAPYGFHWVEKKLTVHPKESIIVKQIFELFRELRRKGAVARRLNEAGYRTREDAIWRDSQVNRILREPAAAGTYFYNTTRRVGEWKYEAKPEDQWSKVAVPAIISADLWNQVTSILGQQEKKTARPGRVPVRLFGGLTVCECGHRMYVPSGSRKYTCTKCKNKLLADDLEGAFCDDMKSLFASPATLEKIFKIAKGRVDEKEARLANHRQEIQKVQDDISRTHQLYLSHQIPLEAFGSYHKPLAERLRQLQDELARLEAEYDHIKISDVSADQVIHDARDLSKRWPKLQPDEKRRIIQSLVERLTIGKGEVRIRYRSLNLSEESTKSQQLV